jgi:signal recognition particle receptor subunit beta
MSSINLHTREINIKVVYYGPGLGGKTTTLQHIHRTLKPDLRGQLVSLATGIDRTLFFDFLPVKLPKVRDFTIRMSLYTVPGQVHYNATRKLVLQGADGVVFVADSQAARQDANIESIGNLYDNLRAHGMNPDTVPLVLQYNKRDLDGILSVEQLDRDLNRHRLKRFETCALSGQGVFEAMRTITKLVLTDLKRKGI